MLPHTLLLAVSLVSFLSAFAVAPPPPEGTTPEQLTHEQTLAVVSDIVRTSLEPRIKELLKDPWNLLLATDPPLVCDEPWGSEHGAVAFLFGDYAIRIPVKLIDESLERRPHYNLGTLAVGFTNKTWLQADSSDDFITPRLRELSETLVLPGEFPEGHEQQLADLTADLRARFLYANEHALMQKLYLTDFGKLDLEKMRANDLVEAWTLLELKRITGITGGRARFARTRRFSAMVGGPSVDGSSGAMFNIQLFDGSQSVLLLFGGNRLAGLSAEETRAVFTDEYIKRFAASVTRHETPTPGRTMRQSAEALLANGRSKKHEMVARLLLVRALERTDDVDASQALLATLINENTQHHDGYVEFLRRSRTGRCLKCGGELDGGGRRVHDKHCAPQP